MYAQRFCLDDIPPDQGNVLRAVRSDRDVVVDFAGAPASQWDLYRDVFKTRLGVTSLNGPIQTETFTDPMAVSQSLGRRLFYYVRGLSTCGETPGP